MRVITSYSIHYTKLYDELFPTAEEVSARFAEAGESVRGKCSVVDWYVDRLVHGILGHAHDHWPVFIISRELAQPSVV